MNAFFGGSGSVPWTRVLGEYRRVITILGVAIAINLAVLGLVVVPLSSSVESGARRAETAAAALRDAKADFENAEATRDGQTQASKDLDRFYRQVLPTDLASARRISLSSMNKKAREHNVTFAASSAAPELVRDSELEHLRVSFSLSGDYDDVREFIYDVETGPEFVIIDNVLLSEGQDNNSPLSFTFDVSTYYRTGRHDR
jgi:Tfp pilus assembly protein PilO